MGFDGRWDARRVERYEPRGCNLHAAGNDAREQQRDDNRLSELISRYERQLSSHTHQSAGSHSHFGKPDPTTNRRNADGHRDRFKLYPTTTVTLGGTALTTTY